MRELKFRAWDTKTKRFMYPWPEGFHLFGETTCFDLMGQQFERGEDRLLRYNDLEVMQYTGLKDKNGKEIYEGDILIGCHHTGSFSSGRYDVVEFSAGGFSPFSVAGWECTEEPEWVEVIGNIYENPDLLGPVAQSGG